MDTVLRELVARVEVVVPHYSNDSCRCCRKDLPYNWLSCGRKNNYKQYISKLTNPEQIGNVFDLSHIRGKNIHYGYRRQLFSQGACSNKCLKKITINFSKERLEDNFDCSRKCINETASIPIPVFSIPIYTEVETLVYDSRYSI